MRATEICPLVSVCLVSTSFRNWWFNSKPISALKYHDHTAIEVWYSSDNLWVLGLFGNVLEIEQSVQSLPVVEMYSFASLPYLFDTCYDGFNEYIRQPLHPPFAPLATKCSTKWASTILVEGLKVLIPLPSFVAIDNIGVTLTSVQTLLIDTALAFWALHWRLALRKWPPFFSGSLGV